LISHHSVFLNLAGSAGKEIAMNKDTLEKILEYASMPVHGTLSRKLRKGVKLQINEGKVLESAVLFMGEQFVRITEQVDSESINTYMGWEAIDSVRTISSEQ
jgi:regulatory protein YycI of two-component signal transduction system YycFG